MGDNQKMKTTNENKGRGLFYGVIAIATFIIMAVGATFAYFTATTSSMNSAVQTGSTTLQLKYISYGAGWMNRDLIPADTTVVEYSFENQNDTTITDSGNLSNILCKDDFGNSICSVYVFQVYNAANSPQSVSINVVSEVNSFSNLNAMAYELTLPTDLTDYNSTEDNNGQNDPIFRKGTDQDSDEAIDVVDGDGTVLSEGTDVNQYSPIYVNRKGVEKTLLKYIDSNGEGADSKKPAIDRLLLSVTEDNQYSEAADRTSKIADDITIPGGALKTFALVLYIKNANIDQTATDAAKTFTGQVVVGSGDGSTGVSGTISASIDNVSNLQSRQ